MNREDGFYWVKENQSCDWEPMRWDAKYMRWHDTYQFTYHEYAIFAVGEQCTKTPDEK